MSIKLRLTLLVGLLLLGFAATLVFLRRMEARELMQMSAAERDSRAQLLNHWLDQASRALPQFTAELAQSEEFSALAASGDEAEARQKIAADLASAGLDGLWIVGGDGTPRRAFAAKGRPSWSEFPLAAPDFVRVVRETPSPRFFAQIGDELGELCVRRQQSENGTRDWVVVLQRWDETHLRTLGTLTESRVALRGPEELNRPPAPDLQIVLLRALSDAHGRTLRTLRVDHDVASLVSSTQTDGAQIRMFFAFGLLVLGAVALALHSWVLRPLRHIGESLARNDPAPVKVLSVERSELGQVATLVLTSFEQRAALEREVQERAAAQQALQRSEAELRRTLEERARLGRDLHDGVIQSLYAAGMGLTGVRTQLRPEQMEAAARLEQTRAALNETIHDVRNFIIGLEPEALKLQTFGQAVAALLDTMLGIRAFKATVDIDEAIATRLSLSQRVHALQIAREAVSNALRHGAASHLTVTLQPAGHFAQFEIADNGSGFNPTSASGSGQGLRNLVQRARELGAELTVESKLGEGARVKLVFSLPAYD